MVGEGDASQTDGVARQATTQPRRALLLLNPGARNGDHDIDQVLERLTDAGFTLRELEPRGPEDVADCVRRHADDADLVIAGGGDGTMNTLAPVLRDTGLPLGLLPLGTANDLARSLCIPFDVEQAAQIIIDGAPVRIDLGKIEPENGPTRAFFNVAHIGFAAEVPRNTSQTEKRWFGPLSYLFAVIRTLRQSKTIYASVTVDDEKHRLKCSQLSVGNGVNYGGGMVIHEDARLDNNTLVLTTFKRRSIFRMLLLGLAMRRGLQHYYNEVFTATGRVINVVTDKPRRLTADGEEIGRTPAKFSVESGTINVIVGKQYKERWDHASE